MIIAYRYRPRWTGNGCHTCHITAETLPDGILTCTKSHWIRLGEMNPMIPNPTVQHCALGHYNPKCSPSMRQVLFPIDYVFA